MYQSHYSNELKPTSAIIYRLMTSPILLYCSLKKPFYGLNDKIKFLIDKLWPICVLLSILNTSGGMNESIHLIKHGNKLLYYKYKA